MAQFAAGKAEQELSGIIFGQVDKDDPLAFFQTEQVGRKFAQVGRLVVLDFEAFQLVDIALVGKQQQVGFVLAFEFLDDLVVFLGFQLAGAAQRGQRRFSSDSRVRSGTRRRRKSSIS